MKAVTRSRIEEAVSHCLSGRVDGPYYINRSDPRFVRAAVMVPYSPRAEGRFVFEDHGVEFSISSETINAVKAGFKKPHEVVTDVVFALARKGVAVVTKHQEAVRLCMEE